MSAPSAHARPDVRVRDRGTIVTITFVSTEAREWADEHVSAPDYMTDGFSVHCDHRPAWVIVQVMQAEGFTLEIN